MVGVFADGSYGGISGLIAGNAAQFVTQLIGGIVLLAWALVGGGIMFALIKVGMGLRASDEEQIAGLDEHEHGMAAYQLS
jgi:Amt family ammonium transporter